MLGSLNSDVTRKYVVYAFATRRSCAKIERVRPRLVEADRGEERREPDERHGERARQPVGVRRAGDDRDEGGEREDEEQELDRSLLDVERPEQRERRPRDERSRRARRASGEIVRSSSPRSERTSRASDGAGEHDVERQQEERVLAAEVDGQPERRGREQADGHDRRPAEEHPRDTAAAMRPGDERRRARCGCESLEVVPRQQRCCEHHLGCGEQRRRRRRSPRAVAAGG